MIANFVRDLLIEAPEENGPDHDRSVDSELVEEA